MNATVSSSAPPPISATTRDRWRGVAAGTLAMLALLVVVVVLRQLTDTVSLLDAMADALLRYLPMSMFSLSLDLFGTQAKTLLLAGLMVSLLILGGVIGWRYARSTSGRHPALWVKATTWSLGIFGVAAIFMLSFVPSQTPGALSGTRMIPVLVQLGLATTAFGVVLAAALKLLRLQDTVTASGSGSGADGISRRQLTARVALGAGALAAVGVLGSAVARVANRPTVGQTPKGEISPAITPNEDFYTISKNFVDPDPNRGDNWFVTVDGLVEREMEFTRTDLEALAAPAFVSTLTCISNPVGGPLIGTAEWVGAPLSTVLRQAGVKEGAVKVVLSAEDDYTDSITIERALQPEPMLVWQMNGVPLPRRHGTPVRLIVPGIYGMKNVKWLEKITVSNENYQGFWQQRGWTDPAIVKTSSRIDVPGDRDVLPVGRTIIGGVAFGGDRGISLVEVSKDGGDTWEEAQITANPSDGGLSWVIWELPWDAKTGSYEIVVRATDGLGDLQTPDQAPELPDGSSGWHRVRVGVA
jgi:DMSO/TMAO reductase YedYZ molybdopterin-dependent catalytic subunit